MMLVMLLITGTVAEIAAGSSFYWQAYQQEAMTSIPITASKHAATDMMTHDSQFSLLPGRKMLYLRSEHCRVTVLPLACVSFVTT